MLSQKNFIKIENNDIFPEDFEVEVSLFGAGVGECILIHLSEKNWVVIDSCLDPESKQPVAIEYLKKIGVDYKKYVKQIIITHWHDDHIKGSFQLVKECENAEFICSTALHSKDFGKLLSFQKDHKSFLRSATTGLDEFSSIWEILKLRNKSPVWVLANKLIFNQNSIKITTLSPSDAEITKSFEGFSNLIPKEGSPKQRIPDIGPNDTSVVLWIEIGEICLLLGSDKEIKKNVGLGWDAIINSSLRSPKKAFIYKVAHHGSITGHHNDIWNKLLIKNCHAILTPFSPSLLPKEDDIKRIKALTNNAACTASSKGNRNLKKDKAIQKTIKEAGIKIRPLESKMGQVKIRYNLKNDKVSYQLRGPAYFLHDQ